MAEKLTEEEKKAREARRRERERRHREGRDNPKPARRLDIIDQMDATGFFGTSGKPSSLHHHPTFVLKPPADHA